jgi:hypothetical protein
MPEQNERSRPQGDPLSDVVNDNPEDNRAQRQGDATPDAGTGETITDARENSDRAQGRGSSANGVTQFDEEDGDLRRKQYKDGATLVSGID